MHRIFLHNNELRESSERTLAAAQVGLLNGWGVFSTVRVVDGVLFAFELHWERMRRDAERLRVPFPGDASAMEAALLRLLDANQAVDATLRVVVVRNGGSTWSSPDIDRGYDLIAFTADERVWGPGVRLGVVRDARHAASPFAGTKTLSWSHNLAWLEEAQAHGLDEVILLNEHGQVSECTSANVFISEGRQIWTPPLDSGCLPGITRHLLLQEIHVPGVSIGERPLELPELERADEVFITSTTRGLLQVLSVEGLQVRTGGTARSPVQLTFSDYVSAYVARAKRNRQPVAASDT